MIEIVKNVRCISGADYDIQVPFQGHQGFGLADF